FRDAIRLGADGVELDVHASVDGELVVHHDPVIAGVGPIAEREAATIRRARLSNGEPIPTLGEALEALGGGPVEVWIELKSLPASADARLLSVVDAAAPGSRCAFHSFDHRIVARLGKQRAGLRRGILSDSYPVDPVTPLRAAGATALWQKWPLIDRELAAAVHQSGAELIAWTVNDRA